MVYAEDNIQVSDRDSSGINLNEVATRHAELMREKLTDVYSNLDLTREELNKAHRYFLNPRNIKPNDFWSKTAVLRSSLLSKAATMAIDEVVTAFEIPLIEYFTDEDASPIEAVTDDGFFFSDEDVRIEKIPKGSFIASNIELVFEPVYKSIGVFELGKKWQDDLYEAALQRAEPDLANYSTSDAKLVVSLVETVLLTEPPWSFTDRLLAAFELSHQEIQAHANKSKSALLKVFAV